MNNVNTGRIEGLRIALGFAESFERQAIENASRTPVEVGCIANGIRACISEEELGRPCALPDPNPAVEHSKRRGVLFDPPADAI